MAIAEAMPQVISEWSGNKNVIYEVQRVIRRNSKVVWEWPDVVESSTLCRNSSLFNLMARRVNRFWVYGGGMSAHERLRRREEQEREM
jgi:hypothetical protein